MDNSIKLIRTSIHSFFCNYHSLASLATILIFPSSAATLLSTSLIPSSPPSSSLVAAVSRRLLSLLKATNFPLNSPLFDIVGLKLSQTILSFVFALPFTLTFLTLSKATIIFASGALPRHPPSPSSILHLYPPLLLTHLFTRVIILSTNVAILSMFLITFFVFDELGLSSTISLFILSGIAAVVYSTTVANVLVICNLATIVAAMESCNGYTAVLKACVLIRGRAAVALFLALCSNLGMAAIEGLFQIRVIKIYNQNGSFDLSLVFEALTIIYIYSIWGVVDNIISCCFYKSCRHELIVKYAKFEGQGRVDLKI